MYTYIKRVHTSHNTATRWGGIAGRGFDILSNNDFDSHGAPPQPHTQEKMTLQKHFNTLPAARRFTTTITLLLLTLLVKLVSPCPLAGEFVGACACGLSVRSTPIQVEGDSGQQNVLRFSFEIFF